MVLRALALLVAVLLLVAGGTAAVASAQEPLPTPAGDIDPSPWWEDVDPDEPFPDDGDPAAPQEEPDAGLLPDLLPDPAPQEPVEEEPPAPVQEVLPEIPVPTTKTVAGRVAYLRADGKAAIPRGAPRRVRQLLAAANQIVGKPYKWGGGHAKLVDRGYDCSGAVSYALIRTGLLRAPRTSGGLTRWGLRGAGRWVSVYANKGHVYLEVAGLRLDTSAVGDRGGRKGVRWRPVIGRRQGFQARHPAGL